MKVTVKNPNKRPVNISRLAPLMPSQTLGVNQEITVNVRDIDSVTKNAKEIGVTVTPIKAFEVTSVVEPKNIGDTSSNEDIDNAKQETDKKETDIVDEKKSENTIETHEDAPEKVETDKVDIVVKVDKKSKKETKKEETEVEQKSKKKATRKSTKVKATKKSILGNNK